MALSIRRIQGWKIVVSVVALYGVGGFTLINTPLSHALTVQYPSLTYKQTSRIISQRPVTSTIAIMSKNKQFKKNTFLNRQAKNTRSLNCRSNAPMHPGLATAKSSQLQKLSQYEKVCRSGIIDRLSFFTSLPTSELDAKNSALDVARQLSEFGNLNINALVFLEPINDNGLVDLSKLQSGTYDAALNVYFSTLKSAGISDEAMGTWVLLPEGNLPVWSSLDPVVFGESVTKIASFQKSYFPLSKVSILLDSKTYTSVDSWEDGQPVSLLPYVQHIPAGVLDSIGLQGFPWSPPANLDQATNGEPSDYLRTDLLAEVAASYGTQNVWLNTGTFSTTYAGQAQAEVTISPSRRLELLRAVIAQAKALQAQNMNVSIHLFAEDKSRVAEATNWSYWQTDSIKDSPSTYVFKAFAHDTLTNDIQLWLFDTAE